MKVFKNLSVSFRLRKSSADNSKTPLVIYCRITLDNDRADFSTKQKVPAKSWDKDYEKVKDIHPQANIINQYLDTILQDIKDCYFLHRSQKAILTLDKSRQSFLKKLILKYAQISTIPTLKILLTVT